MKKGLGRAALALFWFLHVGLFASTYEWSVKANKGEAYINEAVHLEYVCTFSDGGALYAIDFNPEGEHKEYVVKNLSRSERIAEGKRVNTYEFVAFAKKSGKIAFDFQAVMKKTTKESIENTVIGRDNVQREDFTKKSVKAGVLSLHVKEAPSALVGEFGIETEKKEPEVKAYEPYHLHVKIKGVGNFEALKPVAFDIEGVKVFAGEIQNEVLLKKEGQSGEWSRRFAFVSDKDFVIPKLEIPYFDPKEQKLKSLVVESTVVKVKEGYKKEELLEEEEKKEPFAFEYTYMYYLLTFAAGFLAGRVKFKKSDDKDEKKEFSKKLEEAKSLKELSILLVLEDAKKYGRIVSEIETKKISSLAQAKKMSKNE